MPKTPYAPTGKRYLKNKNPSNCSANSNILGGEQHGAQTVLGTDHTEERRYQIAECKDTDTTAKHQDFEQLSPEKAVK